MSKSLVYPGTFVLIFHSVGQLYAWGVIQTELQKQGVGSPVALSWVGGIYAGLQAAFMAPVGAKALSTTPDVDSVLTAQPLIS